MKAKDLSTPKSKVISVYSDTSVESALKIMLKSHFTMIPVLERESDRYIYSLSTSDILARFAETEDIESVKKETISSIAIGRLIVPCRMDTEVEILTDLVVNQNYVPLVDEDGKFVGLVTRKAVINYLVDRLDECKGE